jgi:hypothetical protein
MAVEELVYKQLAAMCRSTTLNVTGDRVAGQACHIAGPHRPPADGHQTMSFARALLSADVRE